MAADPSPRAIYEGMKQLSLGVSLATWLELLTDEGRHGVLGERHLAP